MGVRLTCRKCGKVMGFWNTKAEFSDGYLCEGCNRELGLNALDEKERELLSIRDAILLLRKRSAESSEYERNEYIWRNFPYSSEYGSQIKFDDAKQLVLFREGKGKRCKECSYVEILSCYIKLMNDDSYVATIGIDAPPNMLFVACRNKQEAFELKKKVQLIIEVRNIRER